MPAIALFILFALVFFSGSLALLAIVAFLLVMIEIWADIKFSFWYWWDNRCP